MSRLRRHAALRRQEMEEDAAPILAQLLQPEEQVQAAGLAFLPPAWWLLEMEALSRLYWVALTDSRLIFVRFLGSENRPVFERALPRAGLRVVRDYESRLNRELRLEADEWKAKLRFFFPLASKGDADAFVAAIQNTREG